MRRGTEEEELGLRSRGTEEEELGGGGLRRKSYEGRTEEEE